jgi:hypothetical protein
MHAFIPSHTNRIFLFSLLSNHACGQINASLPLEKGQTHADMRTFFFMSVSNLNGHKYASPVGDALMLHPKFQTELLLRFEMRENQ